MPVDTDVHLERATFSEALLRRIADATPALVFAKDTSCRMIFANPAVLHVIGKTWEEISGRADLEWHGDPETARRFQENDLRIMAEGLSESMEETLSGAGGTKTYLSTRSPLRATDGSVIGLVGISMDITGRKKAEAQRRLMMEELNHRVKNTLAMVQVMARQTLKGAATDSLAWDAFESRLIAMSQAQDMLTREHWVGADIRDIVADAFKMHGLQRSGCVEMEGPSARVDAQTALALAMVLHELGTNALKYGALSRPDGVVRASWRVEASAAERVLDFCWRETGGPKVQPPGRRGFGSRLIEQAFDQHGGERTHIDYLAGGVVFHARIGLLDDALRVSAQPVDQRGLDILRDL